MANDVALIIEWLFTETTVPMRWYQIKSFVTKIFLGK